MKETRERLEALRDEMRRVNVDAVIIPGTDPHQSEYVSDHWKFREWLTGFDGTNGTAVVTLEKACLWTDSRYFLQAERQLQDSGFVMMRENMGNDPDLRQWLAQELAQVEDPIVALDGRMHSVMEVNRLEHWCGDNGFQLATDFRPSDKLWTDRPARPSAPAFVHDVKYAGEDVESKIARLLQLLDNVDADAMLITALDDLAWLYNLRGGDIAYTPVAIAFGYVSHKERNIFIDAGKVTDEVKQHLRQYDIHVRDYDEVEHFLSRRSEHETVLIDPDRVSDTLAAALMCQKVYARSPIADLKAIKNEVQIEGFRHAMERDGAALVRLFRWVEANADKGITEMDVARKGIEERSKSDMYTDESFAMIAGYGEHGAIVHYEPTDATAATLQPQGILLVDTGGQYLDGTTDITRTVTLGNPTEQQKHDFTLVLKGHLALQRARFPEGTCGVQLDVLARLPLWQEAKTYGHGTGHGVGHFLGCHEGPQSIRTDLNPVVLRPGMITSNEPGLYLAGQYGIRTENLVLTVRGPETDDFGNFLQFEPLTLFPYDVRLIDRSMLIQEEIDQINAYHQMVCTRLTPLLCDDEAQWLAQRCAPI